MLASRVGQLPCESIAKRREALEVVGGERDREVVGRDHAVHTGGTSGIELSHEPASDLERLETTAERLGERALDEPLEASLEGLETHRSECRWRPLQLRSTSGQRGRRGAGW